jgi:2-oxoglutarate ferredoxin oxidoreductase subunit delta
MAKGKIMINRERCKACALCVSVCPRQVIVLSKEATGQGFYPAEPSSENECTGCALCAEVCPDVAIEVWR